MTSKNRAWAVAACAALALAVTGCGGDDKDSGEGGASGVEKLSANEVADRAREAMKSATSLKAKLEGVSEGEKTTAEFTLNTAGNCDSSMDAGKSGGYSLIKIGDDIWMKPTGMMGQAMVPTGGDVVEKKFKGKYIHDTATNPAMKAMAGLCDIKRMQKDTTESQDKKWTKGGTAEVDGKKAVAIEGKNSEGDPMTLYVAAEGKPYPLKVELKGKDKATILYTGWDEDFTPKKPSAAETVELAQVEQEAKKAS
ncbi:hypothetical protein [Streptomyces sp. SAJ15]|uniref:hypothetical protein n=1 Tax=Streptomyces sp. SAJ15 TaxID=2011095 RepID=UPI001185CEC6|nr:hypothetical protein [Streptomyces sp. SAJ15]TVL90128.1 hypothetical protein CD790_23620 [Streptomyces sp. SAJ15]